MQAFQINSLEEMIPSTLWLITFCRLRLRYTYVKQQVIHSLLNLWQDILLQD